MDLELLKKRVAILSSPKPLDDSAMFFGVSAGEWDRAMTGGLQEKLDRLKEIAATTPTREVTADTQVDIASIARTLRDSD